VRRIARDVPAAELDRPVPGRFNPLIDRNVVDFPAPFAPIRVTISPSWTSSDTPLSASIDP
jgi:hypothetical protein